MFVIQIKLKKKAPAPEDGLFMTVVDDIKSQIDIVDLIF